MRTDAVCPRWRRSQEERRSPEQETLQPIDRNLKLLRARQTLASERDAAHSGRWSSGFPPCRHRDLASGEVTPNQDKCRCPCVVLRTSAKAELGMYTRSERAARAGPLTEALWPRLPCSCPCITYAGLCVSIASGEPSCEAPPTSRPRHPAVVIVLLYEPARQ